MKLIMARKLFAPREVVSEVMANCTREDIRAVGSYDSLYRNLRKFRNKLINPKPYLYPEVKLSKLLVLLYGIKTFTNTDLLIIETLE